MKRIHVARPVIATVAIAVFALTGCTASGEDEPDDSDTTTVVPTVPPEEAAGSNDPLVDFDWEVGQRFTVYAEEAYAAPQGCSCAIEAGGPELYPAGTRVILFRVVLDIFDGKLRDSPTITIPGIEVKMKNAGEFSEAERYAVLDEHEGPARADKAGFVWLPEGAFGDGPVELSDGDSRTWAMAYYVPEGIQKMTLHMSGYADPAETNGDVRTTEIDVPIPDELALR